jgi:hypothetical protein
MRNGAVINCVLRGTQQEEIGVSFKDCGTTIFLKETEMKKKKRVKMAATCQ